MLNKLIGIYMQENLRAVFETIVYTQSLSAATPGSTSKTTKTLTDAEDGSSQKAKLDSDNYYILDAWSLCDTGHVYMDVYPDADTKKKFRVDATIKDRVTAVDPPKLMEVDLQIDFYNTEPQINNVYLVLNCIRFPQDNLAKIVDLSEQLALSPGRIDIQTLNTHKELVVVNKLLAQLITLQGGTPDVPDWYIGEPPELAKKVCRR